jgi:hypothetical protein
MVSSVSEKTVQNRAAGPNKGRNRGAAMPHNGFPAVFRHTLGTAFPGEAKHVAEPRLGILKLPLLLDRLSSPRRMCPGRCHVRFAHHQSFLTTPVSFYHIAAAIEATD